MQSYMFHQYASITCGGMSAALAYHYQYGDRFKNLINAMSKNESIDRGLKHVAELEKNRCDPIVREMALAVLEEIRNARKKRDQEKWIVLIIVFITLIIAAFVVLLLSAQR